MQEQDRSGGFVWRVEQNREIPLGCDQFQKNGLTRLAKEPAVGRSVVLPELAHLLNLPAAHRFGTRFVAGIGRKILRKAKRRTEARSSRRACRRATSEAAKL